MNIDLSKLTLQQKIGQMFLVSFAGTELSKETKKHFSKNCLGNYIYFAGNFADYKSIRALSDSLQDTAKEICSYGLGAFISVDQEGGMVARVRTGSTHFPSNMAVTASGVSLETVEYLGESVGTGLKNLGININHAPVADVNNNPLNPVIGTRSYSDDPKVVSDMAIAYIRGLQRSGVMANVKHFPGHGDTNIDSHLALPFIGHDIARLNDIELAPFKAAIAAGVDSIMSAHIVFRAIDSDYPATLSSKVMTWLLRNELGFEGLIITDCMSMDAIKDYYSTPRGCVLAINAGVDMICLNADFPTQEQCVNEVYRAVMNGEISMDTIDTAILRILKYKSKYVCDIAPQPVEIYSAHERRADEISEKSITLAKNDMDVLPLRDKAVFAISAPPFRANIANDDAYAIHKPKSFAEAATESLKCGFAIVSRNPNTLEIDNVLENAKDCDIILYAVYNAAQNPGQVRLFDALKAAGKRVVLVTLGAPYDILLMETADVHIAVYEYTTRSVRSTIKAIMGEIGFMGKMPVRIC